jgi:thiosulfate dehydrogenase [quinone] large subunit
VPTRPAVLAVLYGRLALGVGFLSAVADRFGLWGASGARNVAWGDFAHFLSYTAKVNPYLTASLVPALGWFVTVCEIVLGIALIVGVKVRLAAMLSGFLLLAFATGMTIGTGIKTAFDASVFAASAGAFLLGMQASDNAERAGHAEDDSYAAHEGRHSHRELEPQ